MRPALLCFRELTVNGCIIADYSPFVGCWVEHRGKGFRNFIDSEDAWKVLQMRISHRNSKTMPTLFQRIEEEDLPMSLAASLTVRKLVIARVGKYSFALYLQRYGFGKGIWQLIGYRFAERDR